jgi:chromosome segregation ATPase
LFAGEADRGDDGLGVFARFVLSHAGSIRTLTSSVNVNTLRGMADDDRRAEIEAVARELKHNDECGPGPVSEEEYRADAEAIIAALDRVRDARGDDELSHPELLGRLQYRRQRVKDLTELLLRANARADAAEARVRDARDDDEVNTDVAVAQIQRAQADAAARSPQGEDRETARPEQPPPDALGGQPPAEPETP